MAQPAQAEKNESPADSDDTDVSDALEDETATDEDADEFVDHADDAPEEDKGEDGEKPDDEDKAEKPEPAVAKALKDLTVEELAAQLSAEQQMRIAHKFANKTMAAARRAEKATTAVTESNTRLTSEVTTYKGFVDQMTNDPIAALKRLPNFTTLKDFVERCVKSGTPAEPKPLDEIAALRRRLDERDAAVTQQRQADAARASQERVFEALGKEPEKYDLVLTRLGRAELWDAITAYTTKYGRCPNPKVFELASRIEAELSTDIGSTKRFAGPAQKGTPAAAKAQATASKTGKPTGKPSASTSASRKNEEDEDEDEDERERRIIREMREAGELTD